MDQQKFLGKKASPAAIEAINQASAQADAVEREKVYDKNRPEIQYQFRQAMVRLICLILQFSDSGPPLITSVRSVKGFLKTLFILLISLRM